MIEHHENGTAPNGDSDARDRQLIGLAHEAAEMIQGAEPESRVAIYFMTSSNRGAIAMRGIDQDSTAFLQLAIEACQQAFRAKGMTCTVTVGEAVGE